MTSYKGRHLFNCGGGGGGGGGRGGGGGGWVVEATLQPFPDYDKLPNVPMVVNLMILSPSSNEKNVPPKQIKSRRRRDKTNFIGTILSRRSLWRTVLITLLKLKCVRKSEELKVKGSKFSGWNKITTFNERNCIILTILCLVRHGIVFKGK